MKYYLLERDWYKLVDALEEFTDFWNYGRDMFKQPLYNSYVPARTTIMNRPKLNDDKNDDTSY